MNTLEHGTKISAKLILSFLGLLCLGVASSYFSLSALGHVGDALNRAVTKDSKKLILVGELRTGFQEMRAESAKVEISSLNLMIGQTNSHATNSHGKASFGSECALLSHSRPDRH